MGKQPGGDLDGGQHRRGVGVWLGVGNGNGVWTWPGTGPGGGGGDEARRGHEGWVGFISLGDV